MIGVYSLVLYGDIQSHHNILYVASKGPYGRLLDKDGKFFCKIDTSYSKGFPIRVLHKAFCYFAWKTNIEVSSAHIPLDICIYAHYVKVAPSNCSISGSSKTLSSV